MSITSGLAPITQIRNRVASLAYANGGDVNTKRQAMLAKLGFPSGITNEQLDAAIAEEERISGVASGGNNTPIIEPPTIKNDAQDDAKEDLDEVNSKEKTLEDIANDLTDFSKMMAPGKMTQGYVIETGSISTPEIRRYNTGGIAGLGEMIEEKSDENLDMMIADQGARKGISAVEQRSNLIKKTLAQSGRTISEEDANMFGIGEISFEEAINKSMPNMDMIRAERNEMQQRQLGFAKGGIAALAEGGEVEDDEDEGGIKLLGKDGILFDPSNPTDYALAIPGIGLIGLGVKAVTKAPAIIKAANAAFKSAGKAAKKKGFNVRDPKSGKILSDVDAGKATVIGSTTTGKVLRGSAVVGLGGKLLPEGEEKVETKKEEEIITEPSSLEDTRTFFEKLKDAPGNLFKELQDDPEFRARFLAGSMNMMKPVEGFVPVSGVNQFYDAFEDKRQEQLASKLAAAKIAAANKGDSIFENILAGTDEIGSIAVLPTNVKLSLFAGAEDLVATPQGAQIMGVEAGSPVDDSMMITLIQQLQSAGYSGTNLENAIKATIQPVPLPE